jgi:hypothetical protein
MKHIREISYFFFESSVLNISNSNNLALKNFGIVDYFVNQFKIGRIKSLGICFIQPKSNATNSLLSFTKKFPGCGSACTFFKIWILHIEIPQGLTHFVRYFFIAIGFANSERCSGHPIHSDDFSVENSG